MHRHAGTEPGDRSVTRPSRGTDVPPCGTPRSDLSSDVSPHLAHVIEGASVVTDRSGRVVAWGAHMQQMLGYQASEMEGAVLPESILEPEQLRRRAEAAGVPPGLSVLLLPPSAFDRRRDRQVDLGDLDRRGRDGHVARPPSCDWTLLHRDGHEVVASVSIDPVVGPDALLIGYRALCLDVTEERQTNALLVRALIREREAARRLAELDQERDNFVATASHELRTPVASILGYAELLAEHGVDLNPRARGFIDAIKRNANRLRDLSEDLLLLSRSDAGHRGEPRPTDLTAVVSQAWDTVAVLAVERQLELRCDLPAEPVTVLGEPERLERVVLNLVSNAIKFTPDGGSVRCSLGITGPRVLLRVSDTGIGIATEDQAHLFTRFFRGAAALDGAVPGTGLGLNIVRTIVTEHGGEIDVESHLGEGTVVTVSLSLGSEEG